MGSRYALQTSFKDVVDSRITRRPWADYSAGRAAGVGTCEAVTRSQGRQWRRWGLLGCSALSALYISASYRDHMLCYATLASWILGTSSTGLKVAAQFKLNHTRNTLRVWSECVCVCVCVCARAHCRLHSLFPNGFRRRDINHPFGGLMNREHACCFSPATGVSAGVTFHIPQITGSSFD